ncbi:hypothetical protein C8J56DRAFT_806869, partial [Mycena floridula]
DQYYGHRRTAKVAARFISYLFNCPEFTASHGISTPCRSATRLSYFIAHILYRTKLHPSVTFAALVLLQRLKNRFPMVKGSSGHRLFVSAFSISSKMMYDETYSTKSWVILAQRLFTLNEINQMEREMCSYLDWELVVNNNILSNFEQRVLRDFGGDLASLDPL